jgi:AcrR family transcriptional regulator
MRYWLRRKPKGLSGGRIDRMARRSRANKRVIYHYFGSKDGLYLAVLERVYDDLLGAEKKLELSNLAPTQAIERLIEFNFDYCRSHPEFISLINDETCVGPNICDVLRKHSRLSVSSTAFSVAALPRAPSAGDSVLSIFRSPSPRCRTSICRTNWTLSAIFGHPLGE